MGKRMNQSPNFKPKYKGMYVQGVVGMIDAHMLAQIVAVDRRAVMYALYLATNADLDGDVIDSRALAAEHFNVTTRTITRWRASLLDAGYLLPYGGGHKGKCMQAVVKRFSSDA